VRAFDSREKRKGRGGGGSGVFSQGEKGGAKRGKSKWSGVEKNTDVNLKNQRGAVGKKSGEKKNKKEG